jgi:hypothetical protein
MDTDQDSDRDRDPDPAILSWTFKTPTKNLFKKKFFSLLLFEGTFTLFFKDKKSKRRHKRLHIKVFLTIFA